MFLTGSDAALPEHLTGDASPRVGRQAVPAEARRPTNARHNKSGD